MKSVDSTLSTAQCQGGQHQPLLTPKAGIDAIGRGSCSSGSWAPQGINCKPGSVQEYSRDAAQYAVIDFQLCNVTRQRSKPRISE